MTNTKNEQVWIDGRLDKCIDCGEEGEIDWLTVLENGDEEWRCIDCFRRAFPEGQEGAWITKAPDLD